MKEHCEDGIKVHRTRGKDKAKDRYNRNGGFSSKHLRLKQTEMQTRSQTSKKSPKR